MRANDIFELTSAQVSSMQDLSELMEKILAQLDQISWWSIS